MKSIDNSTETEQTLTAKQKEERIINRNRKIRDWLTDAFDRAAFYKNASFEVAVHKNPVTREKSAGHMRKLVVIYKSSQSTATEPGTFESDADSSRDKGVLGDQVPLQILQGHSRIEALLASNPEAIQIEHVADPDQPGAVVLINTKTGETFRANLGLDLGPYEKISVDALRDAFANYESQREKQEDTYFLSVDHEPCEKVSAEVMWNALEQYKQKRQSLVAQASESTAFPLEPFQGTFESAMKRTIALDCFTPWTARLAATIRVVDGVSTLSMENETMQRMLQHFQRLEYIREVLGKSRYEDISSLLQDGFSEES